MALTDEMPASDRAGGQPRPEAQGRALVEAHLAHAVSVDPRLLRRLSPALHPEDGSALTQPHGVRVAAASEPELLRLVHMSEQMNRDAPGRRDLALPVLAGRGAEPVRPLVGKQQAQLVSVAPVTHIAAGLVHLGCVPGEPLLVVPSRELEEGRVQADDADVVLARAQSAGEVARQGTRGDARAAGLPLPPLAVGAEGGAYDEAVVAAGVAPETLRDGVEAPWKPKHVQRTALGQRPVQIVVPRHRQQHGLARPQLPEPQPQPVQEAHLQRLELLALAGLDEVRGEAHA